MFKMKGKLNEETKSKKGKKKRKERVTTIGE